MGIGSKGRVREVRAGAGEGRLAGQRERAERDGRWEVGGGERRTGRCKRNDRMGEARQGKGGPGEGVWGRGGKGVGSLDSLRLDFEYLLRHETEWAEILGRDVLSPMSTEQNNPPPTNHQETPVYHQLLPNFLLDPGVCHQLF